MTSLVQLLSQSLRVIVTLFHVMRKHFRAHLEHFIKIIIRKCQDDQRSFFPFTLFPFRWHSLTLLFSGRFTPLEHKELFLHCLMQLVSNETFLVDLYSNYDTGLYSGDVLETLASFLSKSSIPDSGPFTPLHLYSLNILLTLLDQLSARAPPETTIFASPVELPDPSELVQRKEKKATIKDGVKLFNESPKKGIKYFEDKGLFGQGV